MKRFALYMGIAAGLVASCSVQEEDFATPRQGDVVYYATFEQPAEEGTKVYANENLLLRWNEDDRVSIFNRNSYNQQYRFTGETGDNAGGFRKVETEEFVTGNPITNVVSVYPYQESTKITEDGTLSVTLPSEQHYAENSFGLGANSMVSVTSDNFLQYKSVGGFLRISLYGEGVTVSSITLKGNNGEKLAGKAAVTKPLDGVPTVSMADDATDQITLVCDSPVSLGTTAEESTLFWLVIPPLTFSKGFTVTVNTSNGGVFWKSTTKSVTIERNNLSKMAPIEVVPITTPSISIPEAVDMGLSVKWASFNLGATKPEEYGDYYAWGETEPKNDYSWATYKWCMGEWNTMTKYCGNSEYGYNGFTDGKTALDPEDDAAHVNLGDSWRMPTDEEWKELRNNCTWTWITQNGVSGYLVAASNGNSIFLPAAGARSAGYLISVGYYCDFWSSSCGTDYPCDAWTLSCTEDHISMNGYHSRCDGLSVRPVSFQGEVPVSSIELNQTSVQLAVGESVTLIAKVKPDDATDKTVKWKSLNEEVAKVDENGTVTALLEGNVLITASSGDKTATCSVTVISASFHPNGEYLAFTGLNNESSIAYETQDSNITIEYSYDTQTWYTWNSSLTITLATGIKLYVRGKDWSELTVFHFKMTGRIAASGNIMSLLYYDDFANRYSFDKKYQLCNLFQVKLGYPYVGEEREFNRCLIEAPDLPATVLYPKCYEGLFGNCINLIKAPELPATTLASKCYHGMFYKCKSLTDVPELPAMTLAENCYSQMFDGCSSLTEAPDLPAATLAIACYGAMFNDCSSLTKAPDLPATVLASGCYGSMFSNCTSLTKAPDLPATELALHCYSYMFSSCKNLTNAPELPAMTLAVGCYQGMFFGCKNLTKAPELPATTAAAQCYESMFEGCNSLVVAPEFLPATVLADYCYSRMFDYCSNLTKGPEIVATTVGAHCCEYMFENCTSLIEASSKLPAKTLAESCYSYMFYFCSSLTKAPELPATSLAESCYKCMFWRCSSLTTAPSELPATTLADNCYSQMFDGCQILQAPELPATTLAKSCYSNMFSGCPITQAPELPATTLADYCYSSMFWNCSITKAPDLPATTLASGCYQNMFAGCKSLTKAPELLAVTLVSDCYRGLFSGCESLNYVKMLAVNIPNKSFISGFLSGAASTGTFVKHASASWTEDGIIPSGWTVITATD